MPSIEQLEKLLAADPTDAFVLYGLAQEHAKAGRFDRAIEFFDRCLSSDAGYCYAYYHKARVQAELGRHDEAARTVRSGIEAAGRAGDAHAAAELGSLLDTLG